jgi:hypothetical protein
MADKLMVNFKDIKKPKLTWKADDARNLLIKIGAAIQTAVQAELKEAEKQSPGHGLTVGGVKCTEATGAGRIQVEWTGTLKKEMMQDLMRNGGII